jgi:hypothetical protein
VTVSLPTFVCSHQGTRVFIDIARAIQLGGAVPHPRDLIIIPELSVQDESHSRDLPPGLGLHQCINV